MHKQKVCVVGLGYIGLPTAALLATNGYEVVGVDVSQHAVETINKGEIHIVEPDLDAFVRAAVFSGRLKAYTTPQPGDIYMICVPTPFHEGADIPQPNIDYVLKAAGSIASFLKRGDLVILESTSPVGTTELIAKVLAEAGVDGFNLQRAGEPQHLADFVDLVVPELQNRGIYKQAYRPGSFRQKLFGGGDAIHASHPAAQYKRR